MKQPRPAPASSASSAPAEAEPTSSFRMPPGVADYYQVAREGVSGARDTLPHADTIQRSFGRHDVSDVRAAVGGTGGGAADALGAQAYTMGRSVAFSGSPSLHVAAHEAAHAVQQRAGVHLYGGGADTCERHADAVADKVVRGESAESLLDQHAGGGSTQAVQCKMSFEGKTGWLDADQATFKVPPVYAFVQNNAKAMPAMVRVKDGMPSSGHRAQYSFMQQANEGEITVGERKYAGGQDKDAEEQERSGIVTSMTHETQHAIDDLSPKSPIQNQVANGHGQAKSHDPSEMQDILSELHAHAVQAAVTIQMNSKFLPPGDDMLTESFRPALESALNGKLDRKDTFQKKLMWYLKSYHHCSEADDLNAFYNAHIADVQKIVDWYDQLVQATSVQQLSSAPVNGLAPPQVQPQQDAPQQQRPMWQSPMAWGVFLGLSVAMFGYFKYFMR